MAASPYLLTVRSGPKVERARFAALGPALEELERRGQELARAAEAPAVDLRVRRFEPVHRVVARLELRGPRRLRAGVDVRGDGSAEGYTGRLRRELVTQREDETAWAALRRVLRP
jgi:hypothetical protein